MDAPLVLDERALRRSAGATREQSDDVPHRQPRFGIRGRLLALAGLAFLLPALLCFYLTLRLWNGAVVDARHNLVEAAAAIAQRHASVLGEVRNTLTVLADRPDIRAAVAAGAPACDATMRRLLERLNAAQAAYTNLTLSSLRDQGATCAAVTETERASFGAEAWYQHLARGGSFSFAGYRIGRLTNRPIAVSAALVRDEHDAPLAVLIASIDIGAMTVAANGWTHWPHAALTVLKRSGEILFRYPQTDMTGQIRPDSSLVATLQNLDTAATSEGKGLDGLERLRAVHRLPGDGATFVSVSVPVDDVLAPGRRLALIQIAILAAALLASLATVWLVGDQLILRAVRRLNRAATAIRSGDLTARVFLNSRDELQALGNTFNGMAAGLERRSAELDDQRRRLVESGSQLQGIIDSAPVAIIALDTQYKVTMWSRAAERIFGYSADEVVGKRYPLVPEGRWEEFERLCGRVLTGGKHVTDVSVGRMRKDGRIVQIVFSGSPLLNADGEIVGAVYALEDVTEKRKLEEARALVGRIFATSLDLIMVVDRQGNFVQVSPSSLQTLGYSPDEMIGRSAKDFICPDDLDSTREEMRRARRGRLTRNFDCRYVHRDGRLVNFAWAGIWSEPEQQYFFIGRDMTERLVAEEKLRRSQRLEAVGQLTGGLAHDLNNLLGIVIGNLDLIQDELPQEHSAREMIKMALDACLRGAQLNRSLLAFARRQDLQPQRVDAGTIVRDLGKMLSRVIGERIVLHVSAADGLWPIRVDPTQLESAVLNLAVNARDAMPDGGRLVIEASNVILDKAYANENADVAPGDYVLVAISDTGVGMTAEVLAQVFEPFFTTKEVGKGTGLGLSMVHGFIKQSSGHVKIYSEPGRGTTVRLYLPRHRGEEEQSALTANDGDEKHVGNERVLVVEDNDALRRIAVIKLTRLGYQVIEAGSAMAALHTIDAGAKPDLLFTDIVMPGQLDGLALAREATKRLPGLKVLLTSGFTERNASGPSDDLPWALLSKPYRNAELAQALRTTLARPASAEMTAGEEAGAAP